jgi:SAM-dependent methyltransferase
MMMDKITNWLSWRLASTRIIVDRHRRLNHPAIRSPWVDTSINKEEAGRAVIFSDETSGGRFMEIGCGDAELTYLLGIRGNFDYDAAMHAENKERFDRKFEYLGLDIDADLSKGIVGGDICAPDFARNNPELVGSCAVVYSNNVFEHLRRPWFAAKAIGELLQVGGVCITIVPFSQRYHESPGDYFRYTHAGLESLFTDAMNIEILRSGYDILGRRNDWQGTGNANDSVPIDEFGAWRETWFTFLAFRKIQ